MEKASYHLFGSTRVRLDGVDTGDNRFLFLGALVSLTQTHFGLHTGFTHHWHPFAVSLDDQDLAFILWLGSWFLFVVGFHVRKERLSKRSKPQNKQVWATLQGKDVALERLARQVNKREGPHIKHRIALTDGAKALQVRVLTYCSGFTLILDFIHADEYLWDVANRLFDEKDPLRLAWVEARTLKILSGETQQVITEFRTLAPQATPAQRQELEKAANYFERNLPYMAYDHYLAQGWPIASGVIEGACRHLVKDRFELSGMRWTQSGAENLLRLRAVSENADWDDYHQFRKQRRHLRLYASPFPAQLGLEDQALDVLPQTSENVIPFDSALVSLVS